MELCEIELCTGCAACANSCPKKLIHMEPDAEGFLRPMVQEKGCIDCGSCENSCPILHPMCYQSNEPTEIKAFCAQYRDEPVRLASTSGGVFTALCEWVFQRKGIVFGAAYDDSYQVVHTRVDDKEELDKLRTAKYAQSKIGDCYTEIKQLLSNGCYVLFSGTPCQVAGLSAFLGKEYERLILVDVICHGVPSPAVWHEYIRYRCQTDAQGAAPASINLRSKISGWPSYSVSFEYKNGAIYNAPNSKDPFIRAFVGDLCLRPSCYNCKFKGLHRNCDFTLGDYWGVWDQEPAFNDGKGTSLVLVHSKKGELIWNQLNDALRYKRVEAESALSGNQSALQFSVMPSGRETFMSHYTQQDFKELVDHLCSIPSPNRQPVWKRILKKIARLTQAIRRK